MSEMTEEELFDLFRVDPFDDGLVNAIRYARSGNDYTMDLKMEWKLATAYILRELTCDDYGKAFALLVASMSFAEVRPLVAADWVVRDILEETS